MEFGSQSFFVMPILTASVVISVLTYCSGIFVFDVAAASDRIFARQTQYIG
jgi:hypothetical protein